MTCCDMSAWCPCQQHFVSCRQHIGQHVCDTSARQTHVCCFDPCFDTPTSTFTSKDLCGLPFWHRTHVFPAFQVKRNSSYLKEVRQLPRCQSFIGSPHFGTTGLIPQISGRLTGMRINVATIFVDRHSNHVYVFLMKDLTLDETILEKHAYERFLSSIGVTSKAYHADNGRFADKGFRDDCTSCNQVITFCGVGSHHKWYCRAKDQRVDTWQ
jgi:hypothetical protein